ncbi:response regulator [Paenibacillus sp. GCM10012307]|uniref:Response regulator n=1 Tax=Paenibacillus roseus TaxID=2798579 RepID=A0A934MXA9_9BACL|nr:response regulator [Paenibacillus roseus]MBJ6364002.1 response regulator [Paenibacillus roseus]
MKAILVDDEMLALMQLKRTLEKVAEDVWVAGMYTNPTEVIDMVKQLKPDVVFLDVNMPGINGLEMGEQIQTQLPSVAIVFVTGYDHYAVQAFELCALDYILKPVHPDRLRKTMERLTTQLNIPNSELAPNIQPILTCFQSMQIQLPGQEPTTIKWRTTKAQELFAYLLYNRDKVVNRDLLIELLWSDCDTERGATQLYTTVYLIRRMLKTMNINISITKGRLDTGYKLDIGDVRIDTEEWEQQVKLLQPLGMDTVEQYERVLGMYKGDYLGEYGYLWAEHERERLCRLWLHHVQQLTEFYTEHALLPSAIKINQTAQQLYPLHEESYFNLMKLYALADNRPGLEEQYWLLNLRLELEMGLTISDPIVQWYEQWQRGLGVHNIRDRYA